VLSKLSKQYFTFIRGLITEASPLTFPEGASLDEVNFELNIDGSRQRRLGIDYESGYSLFANSVATTDAISIFEWTSVRNDGTVNYVVVQTGSDLYFYEDTGALSANKLDFSIDLTQYKVTAASNADVAGSRVEMARGKGVLYVVGPFIEPLQISVDETFTTMSVSAMVLYIRDFEGAEEDIGNEVSPGTMTDAHRYNLLNQGWTVDYIADYVSTIGKNPARNINPTIGIKKDPATNVNEFAPENLVDNVFGDARSASGRFIVEAFNTAAPLGSADAVDIVSFTYNDATDTVTLTTGSAHGLVALDTFIIQHNTFEYLTTPNSEGSQEIRERSLNGTHEVVSAPTATTITFVRIISNFDSLVDTETNPGSLQEDTDTVSNPSGVEEDYRPSCVAFYSGRVWYAGTPSNRLGDTILFSQIVRRDEYATRCYQEADPTSQYFTEIVATDGGTIVIGDIDTIKKMVPYGNSLLVFAKNGVWQITVGDQGFFSPSNYAIRRISTYGLISPNGVTIVDGAPVYTADEGLIAITQDPQTGFLEAINIVASTVQTLYNDIPKENKVYLQLSYDTINKKMYLLYSNTNTNKYLYDYQLVFDSRLKAFYKFNITSSNPYVAGMLVRQVVTDSGNNIKYLTVKTNATAGITFSQFSNTAFKDWYTFDSTGVDASAYLITGYEIGEAAFLSKYAPIVHCFLRRTETEFTASGFDFPSSCTMQVRWDWADHTNSGKFGQSKEVYRHRRNYSGSTGDPFDDGQPVIVTRNRVRGRGKSIHIKFSTTSAKDCHIYGWSILIERDRSA
jgi:hypothetical protein